jgi:hypothetical protein
MADRRSSCLLMPPLLHALKTLTQWMQAKQESQRSSRLRRGR